MWVCRSVNRAERINSLVCSIVLPDETFEVMHNIIFNECTKIWILNLPWLRFLPHSTHHPAADVAWFILSGLQAPYILLGPLPWSLFCYSIMVSRIWLFGLSDIVHLMFLIVTRQTRSPTKIALFLKRCDRTFRSSSNIIPHSLFNSLSFVSQSPVKYFCPCFLSLFSWPLLIMSA